jgi:starch-binding outer membrane protein, SusD/RagB family
LYENSSTPYVNPTTALTPAQRLANDNLLSYRIETFESRVWEDKMYFFPFAQNEVNKGFIVQNPGW